MRIAVSLLLIIWASPAIAHTQGQLDLTNPTVRKMLLKERKRLNCKGIYQQTRLKFDAQLKLLNKLQASASIGSEVLASLTEMTILLGQKRREFCELYKVTPDLTKDDYFRVYGELDKTDSDVALLFRYASGQASESELKDLQTVSPQHESGGSVDVNATLKAILQTIDSIGVRLGRTEEKVRELEENYARRRLTEEQKELLIMRLSQSPGHEVKISGLLGDNESFNYAQAFAEVLRASGWKVEGVDQVVLGKPHKGLVIVVNSTYPKETPSGAGLLQRALNEVGIDAPGAHHRSTPPGIIELRVGHR